MRLGVPHSAVRRRELGEIRLTSERIDEYLDALGYDLIDGKLIDRDPLFELRAGLKREILTLAAEALRVYAKVP